MNHNFRSHRSRLLTISRTTKNVSYNDLHNIFFGHESMNCSDALDKQPLYSPYWLHITLSQMIRELEKALVEEWAKYACFSIISRQTPRLNFDAPQEKPYFFLKVIFFFNNSNFLQFFLKFKYCVWSFFRIKNHNKMYFFANSFSSTLSV